MYLSQPLSDFQLVFSPWVEREAERHQKAGHIPVSTLRQRFDWEFVPDADDFDGLVDTDPKDQPVLATAVEAKARYLVTANVRDFGEKDLAGHRVVAVHPGLSLAHHVSAQSYREVLEAVGEKRGREPRDPLSIHEQEISVHLPALFEVYRDLFGRATPDTSHRPPAVSFRGSRCVECYRVLREDLQRDPGLCQRCGADVGA